MLKRIILIVTAVFFFVQIIHFSEHIAQVLAWLFVQQEKPYMTPFGMWCMHTLGMLMFPNVESARQAMLGLEFLHLIGNGIFALGILGLFFFVHTKKVMWALIIEIFHFYEHVSLTFSALFIGKPIGMSTFFGADVSPWLRVSYRVWWHFLFNLIPTVLVSLAICEIWGFCTSRRSAAPIK